MNLPALVLAATVYAGAGGHGPGISFASYGPAMDDTGSCAHHMPVAARTDSIMHHWRVLFPGPPYANPYFSDSLMVARKDTLVVRYAFPIVREYRIVWQWASAPWKPGRKYSSGCARTRLVYTSVLP